MMSQPRFDFARAAPAISLIFQSMAAKETRLDDAYHAAKDATGAGKHLLRAYSISYATFMRAARPPLAAHTIYRARWR